MNKLVFAIILCFSFFAYGQSDEAVLEVEALYDQFDQKERARKNVKPKSGARIERKKQFNRISDLSNLETFQDIAVIQRRFLPKTGRLNLSGGLSNGLNNSFFNNIGFQLKAGYHFNEEHGLELVFSSLSDSTKDITENLKTKQQVDTTSLVVPESYRGIHYKWSPMYGKMALTNESIVPFDLYFTGGFGQTSTAQGNDEVALHLGTGQEFSLSKSLSFNWDLALNSYQASVIIDGESKTKNQFDVFLTFTFSYYFSEAGYR